MEPISPKTAILVDDEQAAHYAMQHLLAGQHDIHLIGQAFNGREAVALIEKLHPDLLFLDIQMPDMTGFEVLAHLSYQPYVVFCTAYDQYAVEAFRQNSIDYLLKPIDDDRFAQCIEKLKRFLPPINPIDPRCLQELSRLLHPLKKATAIPITMGQRTLFVPCSHILYCQAADGYVSLFTDEGKEHLTSLTLKELEELLPAEFLRVQKSYIVHKEKIVEVQKYFNNRLILFMNDHNRTKITTGTSYIESIRKELLL